MEIHDLWEGAGKNGTHDVLVGAANVVGAPPYSVRPEYLALNRVVAVRNGER